MVRPRPSACPLRHLPHRISICVCLALAHALIRSRTRPRIRSSTVRPPASTARMLALTCSPTRLPARRTRSTHTRSLACPPALAHYAPVYPFPAHSGARAHARSCTLPPAHALARTRTHARARPTSALARSPHSPAHALAWRHPARVLSTLTHVPALRPHMRICALAFVRLLARPSLVFPCPRLATHFPAGHPLARPPVRLPVRPHLTHCPLFTCADPSLALARVPTPCPCLCPYQSATNLPSPIYVSFLCFVNTP